MTIGFNIWMACLELNWLFYYLSWMLQLSELVWKLEDRSMISSDQKRLIFAVRL